MVTRAENELLTRVEGDAPLGRLMREHYWIPFALSENLVAGDPPAQVRLFGENYVAFRAPDGRIGFLDELCPHRRASLALARVEGQALRCIYHGWKVDVSGSVVEAPTQVVRHDQFCAGVAVAHFPVHEEAGISWVWLGGGEPPSFPDLPFNDEYGFTMVMTQSVVSANWLQGLEGGMDSVHAPILHRSVIEATLAQKDDTDTSGVLATIAAPPRYETEEAPYGLRQASLRTAGNDRTYVRTAHYYFPLVIVVPNGYGAAVHTFAFAPIDDTHHLLFFGNYGEEPLSLREVSGALEGELPDPRNFARIDGDRATRWGQDRAAMNNGHWSGFTHSAIEEDATVQVSMGPIVDRTKENLSSSDVAIAQTRRLILNSIATYQEGHLPPGSARTPSRIRVPSPFDAVLEADESWRERQPVG
jgi:phenylpropionate dioxygenase-like ring-hydroxylating dioxygenase large terminal subunit